MISFYPGPSRVHDKIPLFVSDAFERGVLSINHRSEEFMRISADCIRLLKDRLGIPEEYSVFFTSSATECWEIIAQSVIEDSSYHLYNGAFGKKWFEYTNRLHKGAQSRPFDMESMIDLDRLQVPSGVSVICLTQNETSNGTQVTNETLRLLRAKYPSALIAIDATSSMAGVTLDFGAGDIWFASVQKCFGLPAGLGIMICSATAMARARQRNERDHYNSLMFMADMMEKWQTPFTPNVLNIYLLMRVLEMSPSIAETDTTVRRRYQEWMEFLLTKKSMRHLIGNGDVRSFTVIPVSAAEALVREVKAAAKKRGILLGEGYGELKPSTFRIANFPAIKEGEITLLKEFLSAYS